MFGYLKGRLGFGKKSGEMIGAPVEGEAVASAEIGDAVFREEMLGKGMAIKPTSGKVYAPVDGTVSQVFGTKHALTILSEGGAELLIHIGRDTVAMDGKPFTVYVKAEDKVRKGELIAEFDIDMIRAAGLDTIIPIVVLNSGDYKAVNRFTGKKVRPGDAIMMLVKA